MLKQALHKPAPLRAAAHECEAGGISRELGMGRLPKSLAGERTFF